MPPSTPSATASSNRKLAILTGAVVGALIVAACGVAYALTSRSSHQTNAAVQVAPLPSPATNPTPISPPVTDEQATTGSSAAGAGLQAVVLKIDSDLSESANDVGQLKSIIAQFDPSTASNPSAPCAMTGAAAALQMQSVINDRQSMVNNLDSLAAQTAGTGHQLVTLLSNAINLSLRSDIAFQAWMTDSTDTDASDPCVRTHDTNWDSSQNLSTDSGAAKQAFLGAYLPAAAPYGVRDNWQKTDF